MNEMCAVIDRAYSSAVSSFRISDTRKHVRAVLFVASRTRLIKGLAQGGQRFRVLGFGRFVGRGAYIGQKLCVLDPFALVSRSASHRKQVCGFGQSDGTAPDTVPFFIV